MNPVAWTAVFTKSADADLLAIYDYIAERAGTDIAHHFAGQIKDYCLGLANVPERGTRRDDLRRGLRTLGFRRRATILFELDRQARRVVILGVYYAGRSFDRDEIDDGDPA